MPKRCAAFGCRDNYAGEPYTRTVSFPRNEEERNRWIDAMPNDRETVLNLKEPHICALHFDCEWITALGGTQLTEPPSIFPWVPKSCRKQILSPPRSSAATSNARDKMQKEYEDNLDKIKDFEVFCTEIEKRYTQFNVYKENTDLTLSMTDTVGRKVVQFVHFKKCKFSFWISLFSNSGNEWH